MKQNRLNMHQMYMYENFFSLNIPKSIILYFVWLGVVEIPIPFHREGQGIRVLK